MKIGRSRWPREPHQTLFDLRPIARCTPTVPVLIDSNRHNPPVPWTTVNGRNHESCAERHVQF
jgi:hypothetical protein